MGNDIDKLVDEAIKLELNVAELYTLYQEYFVEDKEFWKRMADEEKTHASLIKMASEILSISSLLQSFIHENLDELRRANKKIEEAIEGFMENAPPKEEAYKFAVELEESVNELYYQEGVTGTPDSNEMRILQQLNSESKDHAERIKKLL